MGKLYKKQSLNYYIEKDSLSKKAPLIFVCSVILVTLIACYVAAKINSDNEAKISNRTETSAQKKTPNVEPEVNKANSELNKESKDGNESSKVTLYKVTKVVDGDTIDVDLDGKTQRIRLIGVNTPETVHPNSPQECFGQEASDFAKAQLDGKSVSLEYDDSQDRYDKYNRLLAYVYLGDENFNKKLIHDGYAYEYTYNIPYKYQSEFKEAQKSAEKNSRGLWSPNTCNGKKEKQSTQTTPIVLNLDSNSSKNCNIKGNISYNTGEKIYHLPGQAYYDVTDIDEAYGERWFCSEAEAQAAGWRRSKR